MLLFQRSQLEQLLRHARANVPFYKTRLNCVFRKDDSIDWERWNDIPLLTRQDVQQHRSDLLARKMPEGHGEWREFTTSGSTARPITIRVPGIMSLVGNAAWRRFYRAHGIPDKARFTLTRAKQADGSDFDGEFHEARADGGDDTSALITISRFLPQERKLDLIREKQTDVLLGSPNSMEILARANLKISNPVHMKWLVGYGMGSSSEQIDLISDSFKTKVLSSYASKEAGPIALQCAKCDSYHVCEELTFVERLFSGPSNIIVTPLFQSAQPFIRCMQNDTVRMMHGSECGHPHLTITRIEGRVEPIFKLPGGVEVTAIGVDLAKSDFQKICVASQIAQTAPLQFEVRYVADRESNDSEQASIVQILRHEIHADVSVSFHRVDDIPANAGGKQQRFVREFDL